MTVVHVTAIISPKPGKEARVQELLEAVVAGTEANEPGATTYFVTKAIDSNDFIVIETYNSKDAFDAHKESDYFKAFATGLKDEGLITKAPLIIASEKIVGFEAR